MEANGACLDSMITFQQTAVEPKSKLPTNASSNCLVANFGGLQLWHFNRISESGVLKAQDSFQKWQELAVQHGVELILGKQPNSTVSLARWEQYGLALLDMEHALSEASYDECMGQRKDFPETQTFRQLLENALILGCLKEIEEAGLLGRTMCFDFAKRSATSIPSSSSVIEESEYMFWLILGSIYSTNLCYDVSFAGSLDVFLGLFECLPKRRAHDSISMQRLHNRADLLKKHLAQIETGSRYCPPPPIDSLAGSGSSHKTTSSAFVQFLCSRFVEKMVTSRDERCAVDDLTLSAFLLDIVEVQKASPSSSQFSLEEMLTLEVMQSCHAKSSELMTYYTLRYSECCATILSPARLRNALLTFYTSSDEMVNKKINCGREAFQDLVETEACGRNEAGRKTERNCATLLLNKTLESLALPLMTFDTASTLHSTESLLNRATAVGSEFFEWNRKEESTTHQQLLPGCDRSGCKTVRLSDELPSASPVHVLLLPPLRDGGELLSSNNALVRYMLKANASNGATYGSFLNLLHLANCASREDVQGWFESMRHVCLFAESAQSYQDVFCRRLSPLYLAQFCRLPSHSLLSSSHLCSMMGRIMITQTTLKSPWPLAESGTTRWGALQYIFAQIPSEHEHILRVAFDSIRCIAVSGNPPITDTSSHLESMTLAGSYVLCRVCSWFLRELNTKTVLLSVLSQEVVLIMQYALGFIPRILEQPHHQDSSSSYPQLRHGVEVASEIQILAENLVEHYCKTATQGTLASSLEKQGRGIATEKLLVRKINSEEVRLLVLMLQSESLITNFPDWTKGGLLSSRLKRLMTGLSSSSKHENDCDRRKSGNIVPRNEENIPQPSKQNSFVTSGVAGAGSATISSSQKKRDCGNGYHASVSALKLQGANQSECSIAALASHPVEAPDSEAAEDFQSTHAQFGEISKKPVPFVRKSFLAEVSSSNNSVSAAVKGRGTLCAAKPIQPKYFDMEDKRRLKEEGRRRLARKKAAPVSPSLPPPQPPRALGPTQPPVDLNGKKQLTSEGRRVLEARRNNRNKDPL
jgi:hypothetical protein